MYLALAVQTGGTEVWPLLFRAIRSDDPADKAIAFLKRTLGFKWGANPGRTTRQLAT